MSTLKGEILMLPNSSRLISNALLLKAAFPLSTIPSDGGLDWPKAMLIAKDMVTGTSTMERTGAIILLPPMQSLL
jgi:hypothetical protein